jgi:cell division protein FtsB
VAIAAVIALVVMGTSFPAAALLRQHGQLASTSTQLQRLQHQNQLLTQQQKQLTSPAEIERFARQDYQLVFPGQALFNVLPPTGRTATAAGGAPAGDPGNQPLVAPADAPNMSPDPGLPQGGTTGSSGSSASSSGGSGSTPTAQRAGSSVGTSGGASAGGFWHRVTTTVEFWK